MKKTLVAAILGVAALASNVYGQGQIILYNYGNPATYITYGANSGGTLGQGVSSAGNFHVGVYWALTSAQSVSAVNTALAGDGGNGLIPGTLAWQGTTALIGDVGGDYPGQFGSLSTFLTFPGASDVGVTLVVVAYNGADYASSSIRGHSAAFSQSAAVTPNAPAVINMPGFAVIGAVPEPSTFALAGLGLAGLLIFRRRK